MSQQEMSFDESYRDGSASAGYEGIPHYNDHSFDSHGQKLSGQGVGKAPTSGQRLALALVSLVSLVVMTLGLVAIGIFSQGGAGAAVAILFLLMLFYAVVVIINVIYNRKASV